MAKKEIALVRIEKDNVNQVKRRIVGTGYTIGRYYAEASQMMLALPAKITEEEFKDIIQNKYCVFFKPKEIDFVIELFKTYRL